MSTGGRTGLPVAVYYGEDLRFFIGILENEWSRHRVWCHTIRGGS